MHGMHTWITRGWQMIYGSDMSCPPYTLFLRSWGRYGEIVWYVKQAKPQLVKETTHIDDPYTPGNVECMFGHLFYARDGMGRGNV